jgi:hypothetical protein
VPLIFLLVALTVFIDVPFVLLLIGLWFVLGWRHRVHRQMRHGRPARLR